MTRIKLQKFPQPVLQSFLAVEDYIKNCGLDIKLIELVKFRVSQINNCAYCLDMHYKVAKHYGEDPQRLYSVSAWRETEYYSEKEQAALRFAENLTLTQNGGLEEEVFEGLKKHFTDDEIVNLTTVVAQINVWNRTTKVFNNVAGSFQLQKYQMAD